MLVLIDLNNTYFSRNIRLLRNHYRLSCRSLAALVGITVKELRQIEQKKDPPPVTYEVVRRLLNIFALPAEVVFHAEDPRTHDQQ